MLVGCYHILYIILTWGKRGVDVDGHILTGRWGIANSRGRKGKKMWDGTLARLN